MKSVNGINWKENNIPERLILKNKQKYNISYILSKIFLDKKYSEEEIHNSIYKIQQKEIIYKNQDFTHASKFISDCYKNKKKILIFGDYDVDGYSSVYLLYDFLSNLDINCNYFIPNRLLDGYGPNKLLLEKLIKNKNYDLIIFVDCGSNSLEEIKYLENNGLKTIIIDHHQIHEQKKFEKTILINPLKNVTDKQYFSFCATSLVYFFIKYLMTTLKINHHIDLNKYLFFSAIATICDQMPLRGNNKSIVINGLNNFKFNNFKNFNKLLNLKKKLMTTDISFSLGPILNSAGRLGYSDLPINLLIEKNKLNIDRISQRLIFLNDKRKKIQRKTFQLLNKNLVNSKIEVIFNYKDNINDGLLGIIAANLVELYNKPSFVLTNSGKFIKCSSRSVHGFDIGNIFYLAIRKKIILKGGGHSMAGGCILEKNKLKDFKKFINSYYYKKFKQFENYKFYISEQNIESLLYFAKNELKKLEPFGNNNTNPFFLVKSNKIIKFKIIKQTHLQVIIKNKSYKSYSGFAFNAIGTNLGQALMNSKKEIDLILQINNRFIQKNSDFNLIIKDAIA